MSKKAIFVLSLFAAATVGYSCSPKANNNQPANNANYNWTSSNVLATTPVANKSAVVANASAVLAAAIKAPTKPELLILTKSNTLFLRGEVSDDSVSQILRAAQALDKLNTNEPIILALRTPGGSVAAGIDLVNGLKALRRPVHTVTLFAASMGFQTVQQLGIRYIVPFGVLMSHRAHGGMEGDIGGSMPDQITNRLQMIRDMMNLFDAATVARTNGKQTLASYQTAYASEMWRVGDFAIEEGYADQIALIRCEDLGTQTESFSFFGQEVKVKVSKCPIDNKVEIERGNDKLTYEQTNFIKEFFKNYDNYQKSHVIPMVLR